MRYLLLLGALFLSSSILQAPPKLNVHLPRTQSQFVGIDRIEQALEELALDHSNAQEQADVSPETSGSTLELHTPNDVEAPSRPPTPNTPISSGIFAPEESLSCQELNQVRVARFIKRCKEIPHTHRAVLSGLGEEGAEKPVVGTKHGRPVDDLLQAVGQGRAAGLYDATAQEQIAGVECDQSVDASMQITSQNRTDTHASRPNKRRKLTDEQ